MQAKAAISTPAFEAYGPQPGEWSSIALLLDIDGTIIDLAPTPASVVVPPCLRETLLALQVRTGGALALVSGRLIHDIDQLFAPLRLPAIGGHGAEMRLTGDEATLSRTPVEISADLRREVTAIADFDPRILVEDKGYSLAVHYRLAPQREQAVKREIAAILARGHARNLELLQGKAVVEIKPPLFTKGLAVRELMKHAPFAQRRPLFVGDDHTDESVFEVLPELGGFGYSVERPIAGASGMFGSPLQVRAWLERLCGDAAPLPQ